jgi:formate dehydrogenase major subunit
MAVSHTMLQDRTDRSMRFALTIDGRGFASKVSPSQNESVLASECVSCGACVQACPSDALIEKSLFPEGYHRADSL